MALRDVKDLVIRYDGHPKYEENRIIEDDEIEEIGRASCRERV